MSDGSGECDVSITYDEGLIMSVVTINADCEICVDSDDFTESPSGVNCTFIKFGTTGLKCYKEKWLRDRSYSNQLALSELSLAPAVGMKTDVTVNEGGEDCTYYAHETEVLTDIADKTVFDGLIEDVGYDEAWEYLDRFNEASHNIKSKLPDYVVWRDSHAYNVGFGDSGNPMIIDCADDLFGDGSVHYYK